MWISSRYAFLGLVTITGCFFTAPAQTPVAPRMPQFIEQYTADSKSLRETYTVLISPQRMARFEKFYNDELAVLAAMDFDSLSQEDKVDYLLLKNRLNADLNQLAIERQQTADMRTLLPFAETFGTILEQKRLMQRPDAEKDAAALTAMVKQLDAARARALESDTGFHALARRLHPSSRPAAAAIAQNLAGGSGQRLRFARRNFVRR